MRKYGFVDCCMYQESLSLKDMKYAKNIFIYFLIHSEGNNLLFHQGLYKYLSIKITTDL